MEELQGRVAVVTGGASGIGNGMCRAFAEAGMKIVVADVEDEAREAAVKALVGEGADAIGVRCDVTDEASVVAVRDEALATFGKVHVVCNNAGVAGGGPGPLWSLPQADWDWVMGVNLQGVVHGIRVFVPTILEQDEGGHVVNTASLAGLMHGAGIYGVSKQACVALSEALFRDLSLADPKVGVSVLCPAWVRTRIMESERNRPEAPRPAVEIPAEIQAARDMVAGFIERGLDPLDVGRQVAAAIRERRFYILTHPGWNNMLEKRFGDILEGRDPVPVPPAEGEFFPRAEGEAES